MTSCRLPFRSRLTTVIQWAWADLRRDSMISGMSIVLLFLLIGPPLFLEVLRGGVVESWAATLQADPRNREIIVIGEAPLSDADIAILASLPETGFVVPEPSTFISTVRLQTQDRRAVLDMRTSAPGDPILGPAPAPQSPDEVTLTAGAAERLDVTEGDTLDMTLRRLFRDGRTEVLVVSLSVKGIVPSEVWPGEIAFLHPSRAAGASLWLEPSSGRTEALAQPGEDVWRSIRIYAAKVREAPKLADKLTQRGFETRIASEQVALLVNLSDGLRRLMTITVIGGLAGLAVAVWLLQVLSVARRRREIALMAAAGLDRTGLIGFFVLQGLMLSSAALCLAVLCLLPMRRFATTFADRFLQSASEGVGLESSTLVAAAFAVLCLSLIAAATAAWRIKGFDLSADLRAD